MTEIVSTAPRTVVPSGTRPPLLSGKLERLRSFAAQPAVARSLPALGLVALVGAAALLWLAFSAPPSRDLFQALPDQDKAAVVEALNASGIGYTLDSGTGAISVSEGDYHQARMLLAAQGLPKSAPSGGDIIGDLPLGSSRAVEAERLRAARELDLARTIEALDGVQAARVHLAVEPPSAFLRERPKPSASVMLTLDNGRTLGDQQVQAIVHLVSSSVPGMSPEGVSVADQNGRLLSRQGDGGLAGAAERQVELQAKIEQRYRQSIETLLTPILGAGNFTAQVHADVDFSERQATREDFPKEGSTLRTEEGAVTLDEATAAAVGIPGALANRAPLPTQVAAAPDGTLTPGEAGGAAGQRRSENYLRNFAVGREVSVTRHHVGEVVRLSVAVALKNAEGQAHSPQELAALEELVKGAVGFDQGRGDVVALTARSFVEAEIPAESWWEASWVGMLVRNLTALLIAALLLFGIGRPLMKKSFGFLSTGDQRPEPSDGVRNEIASALSDQTRAARDAEVTLGMIEAAASYEARAALIRNFVRQDPARAALVVRDLIRADSKDGGKNG